MGLRHICFWLGRCLIALIFICVNSVSGSSWSEWWSYDSISGPDFWGLINTDWTLCTRGKYQSPIDIDPKLLLYDPNLGPLNITKKMVSGAIVNTGQDLTLMLDGEVDEYPVLSGGPLTYRYRIHHLTIHFGKQDEQGSEHRIRGVAFPIEIQLVAFNEDLFPNYHKAQFSSFGITVVSLLGQLNSSSNEDLHRLIRYAVNVQFKGNSINITDVFLGGLLPNTKHYLTYEGSLTHPGCHEVVTWIIVNKPLYISKDQLTLLRSIYRVDEDKVRLRMENNFRPVMPLNNRTVRTNILPNDNENCRPQKIYSYEVSGSSWSERWSYDSISGPDFWGLINTDWTLCTRGKYQSPIDIDPKLLLYDPNLGPLNITKKMVSGAIVNTGQDLTLMLEGEVDEYPVLSGGPLTYRYRIHHLTIHFGKQDEQGSEHRIRGVAFPIEIQLVAFNEDLFPNYHKAQFSSFGITVVSLLGQLNSSSNEDLHRLIRYAVNVQFKGNSINITDVFLGGLLPNTKHYLTYEGSLTHPGCHEVVTWIIVNKPLYISKDQLTLLRSIYRVDEDKVRLRMENNFRPVMPLNNRTVRTNILPNDNENCRPQKIYSYEVNERFMT